MSNKNRPLSPHLQVYRPQLTSVLSITHRASGVFLAAGTLVLVCWLASLAGGAETYARAQEWLSCWVSQVALFGWTAAMFYHLCNGIRHLFWDAGAGLQLNQVYASGYAVLAVSAVLTLITWAVAMGWLLGGGN